MRYRPFANTGLFVSEICLGTMTFGNGSTNPTWAAIGQLGPQQVQRMLGSALDAGVNFVDTADVYSGGQSEILVGDALDVLARPRDQVILATKVRGRTGPGPNDIGLSRGHVFSAVDASLRRLKVDYIDLYQIHGEDAATPIEETVRALDDLVRSGKVRYVGFANLAAWQAMKALGVADANGLARFVSAQVYYSIVGRDIEREIVALVQDQHLAVLPWSPLAGGLLSGKYDLESPGPDGARRTVFDFPPVDMARARVVLAALRKVSGEADVPVASLALAWLLTKPFVTSVIIGAKTQHQFEENVAATDVRLSETHLAELNAASVLPSEYPDWMIAWQGRGRQPE
jgi:aryl-alcohol dehydrogenase-like predicted oxidoreductase